MSAVRIAVRLSSRGTQPAWIERSIAGLRALDGARVERCMGRDVPVADVLVDFTDDTRGPRQERCREHWVFLHGTDARRDAPALHEHLAGERCVVVRLARLEADGSAAVLEEGSIKAVPYSLARTRQRLGDAVRGWPARHVRRLLTCGRTETIGMVRPAATGHGEATALTAGIAGIAGRALTLAAAARNAAGWGVQQAWRERWTLGVIERPLHHVLTAFDPAAIRWLTVPASMELADPDLATDGAGRRVLLAESLAAHDRRGRIVALEWPASGRPCTPREVLDVPCHASHPTILRHGRQVYCLPETSALGRVQLWRADPFPDRWVADRVLLDGFAGTDATILEHEGRWWMLAGDRADQDQAKLFAFHAPHLFGPWEPHPGNPVKCDLRSARPAGRLFRHGGELYRPAQDCSRTYGGAIVVHRVTELSPRDFREEPVARLAPDPHGPCPHGLHTLAGDDEITLVDGNRHVLDALAIPRAAADAWRSVHRTRLRHADAPAPRAARNEA